MSKIDSQTWQAFLFALSQIKEPLPPDVQTEVNAIGKILVEQPETAQNQLIKLSQHPLFEKANNAAFDDWTGNYIARPKNKAISVTLEGAEPDNLEIANFSLPQDLPKLLEQILISPHPEETVNQLQQQLDAPNPETIAVTPNRQLWAWLRKIFP
jgi:hypothetical protein